MQENQEVMFKVILNYSWNLGFSFQTKRKSAERNEILHIAPWLFSGLKWFYFCSSIGTMIKLFSINK